MNACMEECCDKVERAEFKFTCTWSLLVPLAWLLLALWPHTSRFTHGALFLHLKNGVNKTSLHIGQL